MKERRRYSRFIVEEMGIGGNIMFTTEVRIHDISLGGACISLERKLNLGTEYTLEAEYEDESVRLTGEVVWEKISDSRKDTSGEIVPIYMIGMKFKDVIGEKGAEIVNFICKVTNDPFLRLMGVRVQFFAEGKAFLNCPEDYFVKRISLGGMLIDLDHPLEQDSRFPMEVYLPGETEPIRFQGRVASSQVAQHTHPVRYEMGIEIMEISERHRAKLQEFISSLETLDKGGYTISP